MSENENENAAAAKGATCSYARIDGSHCTGSVESERGLCFWHDAEIPKDGADVRKRLEEWADTGESMEGFHLHHAALEGELPSIGVEKEKGRP